MDVAFGLLLFEVKPVPHSFVDVVHCLLRSVDGLTRQEWQETLGINQLHKRAALVERQRSHNTVPSVSVVDLCSLPGMQGLKMMGKQQLDRLRHRAVR